MQNKDITKPKFDVGEILRFTDFRFATFSKQKIGFSNVYWHGWCVLYYKLLF